VVGQNDICRCTLGRDIKALLAVANSGLACPVCERSFEKIVAALEMRPTIKGGLQGVPPNRSKARFSRFYPPQVVPGNGETTVSEVAFAVESPMFLHSEVVRGLLFNPEAGHFRKLFGSLGTPRRVRACSDKQAPIRWLS
jgi:hypothetical protein